MKLAKKKFVLVSSAVILAGAICFVLFRFVVPGFSDIPASGDETFLTETAEPSGVASSPSTKPAVYGIDKPFELVPEDADGRLVGTDSGYYITLGNVDYTEKQLSEKIAI